MEPLEFEAWMARESRAPARQARYAVSRPQPARQGGMQPWNGDSLSVVARLLSVADYEAAAITQQASYQAAMITRQVAYEATEIRDAAQREADQIRQQAAAQASAVREAAEKQAAEVRTAVMAMQTELSEFAERITDTFPNLAMPRIPSAERPVVNPTASPVVSPVASPPTWPKPRPHTVPAEMPAGRPVARPAGRPTTGRPSAGRGRQVAAMRFAVIATSALFLVAVVVGVVEIHLHGFDFFIFRSTGTGETGPSGLNEDQGPGQPDAWLP